MVRNSPDNDDVEGHGGSLGPAGYKAIPEDDVEGHDFRAVPEGDDVEGHDFRAVPESDDVEGHGGTYGSAPRNTPEDDVEGHGGSLGPAGHRSAS